MLNNLGRIFGTSIMLLICVCFTFLGNGFDLVDSMLIVTPIVGFCNCSMFCFALRYVHSSLTSIWIGKRELFFFALRYVHSSLTSIWIGKRELFFFCLSSWCLVIGVLLFLTMPWVYLQFVIVVFPDHSHCCI